MRAACCVSVRLEDLLSDRLAAARCAGSSAPAAFVPTTSPDGSFAGRVLVRDSRSICRDGPEASP